MAHLTRRGPTLVASLLTLPLAAQQTFLFTQPAAVSRTEPSAFFYYSMAGRLGDVYVLLVDFVPGPTPLFGQSFDLGLSAGLFALEFGVFGPTFAGSTLLLTPTALPPATLYLQCLSWDVAQGFSSLQVSNSATLVVHDSLATVFDFRSPPPFGQLQGDHDPEVQDRLQALPPQRRTVRPLAATTFPLLNHGNLQPTHPSGARTQTVLRATELGADGHAEQLTAVRWRPMWGVVVPEALPQIELHAALTDVVPDYTIDPWSALPVAPLSGLSTTFADNPRPGTSVVLYSGPYSIQPSALQASGYLPFPAPQAAFVHDGSSALLLEVRCQPTPGLGLPQNRFAAHFQVLSAPEPFATVTAIAGTQGQPSPLPPGAAPTGTGASFQYDLELEFLRTRSVATTDWLAANLGTGFDYQPAQVAALVPPGCSLQIEYRGASSFAGPTTPWSTNQDVADGMPLLQARVTMTADPVTGAVPWVQTIVVPVL